MAMIFVAKLYWGCVLAMIFACQFCRTGNAVCLQGRACQTTQKGMKTELVNTTVPVAKI